ncbi:hypothetical protein ILUMI_00433 [Ignelater luminosus]|uniref:Uncharacterized protein n=1 Tax=Ignelater luminosus TaxID=2038154 RepID=A0A8K0GQ84_IGNLU|nr:hypothetical protein ILUMI_00433 [Ignelater luminosus]
MPSSSGVRRLQKTFLESSKRTKRRITEELQKHHETQKLTYAAHMSLRSAGETDAAKLMNEALDTTPTTATRIRKAWLQQKETIVTYTPEKTLSLFIETKLTKNHYMKIRTQAKLKNADIYPNYHKLRAAKEQCYPDRNSTLISDSVIEVKLQARTLDVLLLPPFTRRPTLAIPIVVATEACECVHGERPVSFHKKS